MYPTGRYGGTAFGIRTPLSDSETSGSLSSSMLSSISM
nr:MAG TPA: hypothetical protein [Caudoviricetes sp.]